MPFNSGPSSNRQVEWDNAPTRIPKGSVELGAIDCEVVGVGVQLTVVFRLELGGREQAVVMHANCATLVVPVIADAICNAASAVGAREGVTPGGARLNAEGWPRRLRWW